VGERDERTYGEAVAAAMGADPATVFKTLVAQLTGGELVVAVVPVTLLVVALDLPIPRRFDFGVPIYGEAPVRKGDVLRGNFAVDALAGGQMRLDAGTYQAYAICDTHIQGPQPFTV